ncbi:MAG: FAD-binding protein, partial [Candidatus Caldarchaeum sp.]|nr:FAD-binding protein [Candidatus Caldarchaeum sp.]
MKALVFSEKAVQAAGVAAYLKSVLPGVEVSTALFSEPSQDELGLLGGAGVVKVWMLPQSAWAAGEPSASAALSELVAKTEADILAVWASKTGNEVAARAAQRLKASYASECVSVEKTSEGFLAKRLVLGGGYTSKILLKHTPFVVSLKASAEVGVGGQKPDVEKFNVSSSAPVVEFVELIKPESAHVELEKAEAIVAVGRGFKKKEDLSMAEELARLINAEIGCSRPISGDLKWLSEERHIGLSGKRVRPKLYIALGISG